MLLRGGACAFGGNRLGRCTGLKKSATFLLHVLRRGNMAAFNIIWFRKGPIVNETVAKCAI
jgi:hypothetical protein